MRRAVILAGSAGTGLGPYMTVLPKPLMPVGDRPGERLDFPDLILKLIAAGEKVRAWCSQDHWLDTGRPDDYEQAQDDCERMRSRLLPNG